MQKDNYTPGGDITHNGVGPFPGQMTPRVIKINVGDIWTTNALFGPNTSGKATISKDIDEVTDMKDLVGKNMKVNETTGFLELGDDEDFQLQAVQVYTMADGQQAVKVMRIK